MKPPFAEKRPKTIEQHGSKRVDEYHWLRDANWQKFIQGDLDFADLAVKSYLDSEASYTQECMRDTDGLQNKLYEEILGRIKEDDETYPWKKGDWYYLSRMEKGKEYPQFCRRKGRPDGDEKVYLDVNKEAEGQALYMMGRASVNEAGDRLAWCFNLTGSLERTLKVRDLNTGKDFPWQVENTTGAFLWVNDKEIAFIERGPQSRGQKIWQFSVLEGPDKKRLIYDKPVELNNMYMNLQHTTDRKYQVLYLNSGATSEVMFRENNKDSFQHFMRGEDDVTYSLEHRNGLFYILTNEGGHQNSQVFTCPVDNTHRDSWSLYLPESPHLYISDIDIYGNTLVVIRKNNEMARPELALVDLDSKKEKLVQMKDEAYSLSFLGADDPNSPTVRISYESCIQPSQDIEVSLADASLKVLKTKEVPNYNVQNYFIKREFAIARDGEKIPLTVVTKKGFEKNGEAPAFVYAYGSYGFGMPAYFSPGIFSLVDRGFVYVIAHIRGGNEKGFQWYLDGKLDKKLNTFYDYIDACEFLIENKYTSKGRIAANGGSAGGLLMGAVTNMRPDLFGSVIADVAFVDVISTISDETLPLTPPEWEEWGNPIEDKRAFDYMMKYSPYDNVESKDYPPMLYNSGISDEQVTYWEPAKMVARLRDRKTDDNLLLLNIRMHAGHAGASKRYESIRERAFDFAFILKTLGL